MLLHALNKHETSQANPNKGRIFSSITSVCILPNCLRCASLCSTQCQNAMRESENIVLKRISSCSFALALFLAQWRFFRIRIIHQRFKSFYLKQMLLFACLVKKYHFERTSQFDKCQELWKLLFFFESCSLFENCKSASLVESYLVVFWTHEVRWFLDIDCVVVLQRHHQRNSIDGLSNWKAK